MKWQGRGQSSNVDDRRGQSGPKIGFGGFSSMLMGPLIKILFSKVGLIIAGLFIVFSFITGNNPLSLLSDLILGNSDQQVFTAAYQGTEEENELADLSATILASTEEALNAANAIGYDRLQKQSSGRVVPDSFTHGTSEQRLRWFKKGFETGDISLGDTFNAKSFNKIV